MLGTGERMFAYPFSGYWKDVGTIDSLWEANMDLLGDRPVLKLNDASWRIYARHEAQAPHFIAADGNVKNSSITEGCEISGCVVNSVIGSNVEIGKGAEVIDSVIMSGVKICDGAKVKYSIIDSGVTVGENAQIGEARESGAKITVVGAGVGIEAGKVIKSGEMIYGK